MIVHTDWDDAGARKTTAYVLPKKIDAIAVSHDGGRLFISINEMEVFKAYEGTRDCCVELNRAAQPAEQTGRPANEVTEPGAYEWLSEEGHRHLGFILKDKRGRLHGSFVREDGASRAVSLELGRGEFCEGRFFGPLERST